MVLRFVSRTCLPFSAIIWGIINNILIKNIPLAPHFSAMLPVTLLRLLFNSKGDFLGQSLWANYFGQQNQNTEIYLYLELI